MTGSPRDWVAWHERYEDPDSPLSRRLRVVQRFVGDALDAAPQGHVRVVSMCAGQGRDLLGALAGHPRRGEVTARLVELDERNVAAARTAFAESGLDAVEVVAGDAALTDAYAGAVPAQVVLVCGVLGNVSDADVERIVEHLPGFCAPGAAVVWTRYRRPPDLTGRIRGWFARRGFEELAFDAPPDTMFGVGLHRLRAAPAPLPAGVRLFTFVR
jgi:hypothetical protein